MDPILSHTLVTSDGQPEEWLYLLHGIYGSGRNWGSVARRLVEARPDWGVVLADLRLHGGSRSMSPPHTLERCSDDVVRLEAELSRPAGAILGHSFGGKVALVRASRGSAELRQVWVVDSTLRTGAPTGSPWEIIGIVRSLPDTFASRDELAQAMARHGYPLAVGQWLAMNLEREGDRFGWRLDWRGVEEMLRDYFRTDVWGVVEHPPEGMEVHVVKAADSAALDGEATGRIEKAGQQSGSVYLHVLTGGHWVNVDNPEGVLRLLADHLP